MLVHPHTEIVDPRFCPPRCETCCVIPMSAVVGCAGATGVRSIAWWEGQVTAAPSVQQYGEYGGGELPAFSWTEQAPPPCRGRDHRRPVAGAVAVGGAQPPLRRGAACSTTASTSTSAFRSGRPAAGSWSRTSEPCFTARSSWSGTWTCGSRRTSGWPRSGTACSTPEPADEEAWKRRARHAEADREAARAIAFSKSLKLDARVLELEREFEQHHTQPVLAADGPAAGSSTGWRAASDAQQRTNPSSSVRRISSLETTDWAGATPARARSLESRSATENALDSSSRRAPPAGGAAGSAACQISDWRTWAGRDDGRGWPRAARGSGCGPTGRGSARARPLGRGAVPHGPEAEESGHDHQP